MDTRKGRRVIIYHQRCRDNVSIVTESLMVHWASTMNSTNQTCTMNMKTNTLLFRGNPNKKDLYLYLTINLYVTPLCFPSPTSLRFGQTSCQIPNPFGAHIIFWTRRISRLQINEHSKDLKFVQVTQKIHGSLYINENERTLFDFKCIFHKTFN